MVFKFAVKELKNSLPYLGESGSEVSHFIYEPKNFAEFTKLPVEVKKDWMKATLKENKNLINNQTFIMDNSTKGYPVTPYIDLYKGKTKPD